MHLRNLVRVLLLAGLGLTSACAHGGSGLLGSVTGGGSNSGFKTKDLAGAWTGILSPIPPLAPPSEGATDPYPFYFRCDPAGQPTEGADARGTDWNLALAVASAAVNKQGEFGIEVVAIGGIHALTLIGSMDSGRLALTGTYKIQQHLSVIEQGTFAMQKSAGPGQFSVADQLEGSWSGIAYRNTTSRYRDLLLDLDAAGSVIGGELVGEHTFIPNGPNVGIFTFAAGDDEVGRLNGVVIQSSDGSTQTLHFLLVSLDGSLLGGPGTDSTLGDGIARLEKVVPTAAD